MSVYKSDKAAFLDRSLHSVWTQQTLKPNQIVLVEDGWLPDELQAVICEWKERLGDQLVLCFNENNLGLTKSLNKGLQLIHSDYVARMDSDDMSVSTRFEKQVSFLNTHPDIDIIGGASQEFDEDHECLYVRHYPLTHEEVKKYILKANPLAHSSVTMRTRIFENGLKYDERFRMTQDLKLWYDAILEGYKIANLPDICVYFRRQGEMFKRRRKTTWDEFKIYVNGIYRMKGLFTTSYRFPIGRLFFRNMPRFWVRRIYSSPIRQTILEKKQKKKK